MVYIFIIIVTFGLPRDKAILRATEAADLTVIKITNINIYINH